MTAQLLKTASGSFPAQGNRELLVLLNFSGATSIAGSLFEHMTNGWLETVQSCFIDNSANPAAFTLVFNNMPTGLSVPGYTQGIYPVIAAGIISYVGATAQGPTVPVIFSNTPKTPAQWKAQ